MISEESLSPKTGGNQALVFYPLKLPGSNSSSSSISGSSIESIILGIREGEALAVQRHSHHQLGLGAARLGPVVHGEILIKMMWKIVFISFCFL